jgi:hypothetical protein
MGLEAKRSWGPSAMMQVLRSGLPVGKSPDGSRSEAELGPISNDAGARGA